MNRQDFIFTLFDNGNGLTLDQIERAEAYAAEDAACQTFDDEEIPALTEMARDVYIDRMKDCEDMLELRSFLYDTLYAKAEQDGQITDMQVYSLWYAKED